MPQDLILNKAVALLKVLPLIIFLFYIPGTLLRKLLNRHLFTPVEGSLALDFSLGYFLMLVPGLVALYGTLSWTVFFILWSALLFFVILVFSSQVVMKKQVIDYRNFLSFLERQNLVYKIIAYSIILFTFIILFVKGGHFIGDHQHHLAYIQKLLHNDTITPWVPMFEGSREIPYNYAYDVNYLFNAILVKLSGTELNLFWDNSPALFFLISFSAFTYFYKLVLSSYDTDLFYPLFVIGFIIYQLINWDRKLDFEFMPIPDQFARNIFLPLILALFVKYGNAAEKKVDPVYFVYSFILLSAIMFTHTYSFMVLILICSLYTFSNLYGNQILYQKIRVLSLYVITMLSSLMLFFLRIYKTTFFEYLPSVSSFIDNNIFSLLLAFAAIITFFLIFLRRIELFALKIKKKRYFQWFGYGISILFLLLASFFISTKSSALLTSISGANEKYYNFITEFKYPWFMFILLAIPAPLTLLRDKIKISQSVFVFLWATSLTMIIALIPPINIILSKLFTTVYVRRFVFLQDVYLGISVLIVFTILFSVLIEKFSFGKKIYTSIVIFLLLPLSLGLLRRLDDETYNRDYVLSQNNVFKYIRENIEPGSVIASYKYSAMDIVGQTGNYIVYSETVHSPVVSDTFERFSANRDIFKHNKSIQEMFGIYESYKVKYILTERNNKGAFPPEYNLERFIKIIQRAGKSYINIYQDSKYSLFQINYLEFESEGMK